MIEIELFEELDDRGSDLVTAFVHPDLHIRYSDGSPVSRFTLARKGNQKQIELGLLRMRHANIQEKLLVIHSGESDVSPLMAGMLNLSLTVRLYDLKKQIKKAEKVCA